eukprot:g1993.t1
MKDELSGCFQAYCAGCHEHASTHASHAKGDGSVSGGVSRHELGRKWKAVLWPLVLEGKRSAPYYFMRSGLIRKDLLPRYAGKHAPLTLMTRSYEELVRVVRQQHPEVRAWVLKYSDSSNAFGMHFFDGAGAGVGATRLRAQLEALRPAMADGDRRVVQEYVAPHLLRGRKYHVRALALAVGDLRVYLHDEARVLVATEPLRMGHLGDRFSHVTNLGTNEGHAAYCAARQNFALRPAGAEAADPADAAPLCEAATAGALFKQMRTITSDVFEALSRNRRHFFSLPRCHELFGLDFMVDESLRVWLLEANPDPSMKMFGCRREDMLGGFNDALAGEPPAPFRRVFAKPPPEPKFSLRDALARLRARDEQKAAK